jgi:hypothetical protein
MKIKHTPADTDNPREARTNLGTFVPGEVKTVGRDDEDHAAKLIDNGEFEETEEEVNTDEARAAFAEATAPEDEGDDDGDPSTPRKRKKKKTATKKDGE